MVPLVGSPEAEGLGLVLLAGEMGEAGTTSSANVKGIGNVVAPLILEEKEGEDIIVITDLGTVGSADVKETECVVILVILVEKDDDAVDTIDGREPSVTMVAAAKGNPNAKLKPVPKLGAE